MTSGPRWRARNRILFLVSAAQALGDDTYISFEGDLSKTNLLKLPGVLTKETAALRRNTIWPEQQFVILPLSSDQIGPLISALGGTVPKSILHIQLATNDRLEAAIYDGDNAAFFDTPVSAALLSQLLSNGAVVRDQV